MIRYIINNPNDYSQKQLAKLIDKLQKENDRLCKAIDYVSKILAEDLCCYVGTDISCPGSSCSECWKKYLKNNDFTKKEKLEHFSKK